jgi:retron-type reverse transcriptase
VALTLRYATGAVERDILPLSSETTVVNQTAIAEARGYVEEGYHVVVDLDLEKFFDRVHHQRLMSRLAERVDDNRLLSLIGRMLKVKVVMPDGVKVATEEGVPQGGPLSPLLSNIVLSELDWELARRGHRFVRYADLPISTVL